jgi:hypothetical protein
MRHHIARTGAALLMAVLLNGCGGSDAEPSGTGGGGRAVEPRGDASARLACGHWANVFQDAVDGVLTDAEIRDKIIEIEDSASVSEQQRVATAARSLLQAATANDGDQFLDAANKMNKACRNIDGI